MNKHAENLSGRLEDWLKTEGYPLEYYSADILRSCGFEVRQGEHTRSHTGESPRELDVVASITQDVGPCFVRCEIITECKWSGDKPWVIFTSQTQSLTRLACMMQTFSDDFGQALLWFLSDGPQKNLSVFENPLEPGFGGRQAFSKNDLFYSSMAAVTDACASEVAKHTNKIGSIIPESTLLAFPLIVLDGQLYKAHFDSDDGQLRVHPAEHIRCHWAGSPAWPLHATVDVVTRAALSSFAHERFAALNSLCNSLASIYQDLLSARDNSNPGRIVELVGSRSGSEPHLIRRMLQAFAPRPSMSELGKNLG